MLLAVAVISAVVCTIFMFMALPSLSAGFYACGALFSIGVAIITTPALQKLQKGERTAGVNGIFYD